MIPYALVRMELWYNLYDMFPYIFYKGVKITMNRFKLKKRSTATTLVTLVLVLAAIRFITSIMLLSYDEVLMPSVIVMLVIYGIVVLVCIILLLRMRHSQLSLNEDGLVYTSLLGATRNLSYKDLQKLSMGGRSYILYTIDGKKLITFDDFRTDNASEIVAFLKSKGVRTEI